MRKKRALISFVGNNDRGGDPQRGEGAILAVFGERKFDKAYLLWVNSEKQQVDFREIAESVKHKLHGRKLCKEVELVQFNCLNVVDHNEIYQKMLETCSALPKEYSYTAAISSGTPSMQACWLLLAESGDFELKLIRTNEATYGSKRVEPVYLNSTLPKIVSLRNEVAKRDKEIEALLPTLVLDLKTGLIKVGDTLIKLAPAEFSHYCVLAKRAVEGEEAFHFDEEDIPQETVVEAFQYYKRAFKHLYENYTAQELKEKESNPVSVKTWRSFISRINTAFKKSQLPPNILHHYEISIDGKRNSTLYSIKAHPKKIKFKL